MPTSIQEKKIGKIVEQAVIRALHKASLDRQLSSALEDIRKGRVSPAFSSARAAVRYLHRQAKKLRKV